MMFIKEDVHMKAILTSALTAYCLMAYPAAQANEAAALLQKAGCMACHSADKKILGPSFKEISAKYKGQSVEAQLVKKIKEGGSGVWGPIPMPANAGNLTDAEFKSVVSWMLSL
jgi:cytochrome c